jgi:hypothetical protein
MGDPDIRQDDGFEINKCGQRPHLLNLYFVILNLFAAANRISFKKTQSSILLIQRLPKEFPCGMIILAINGKAGYTKAGCKKRLQI